MITTDLSFSISFPQAPVAQLMVTGLPLWLVFFALKFYQKCIKKNKDQLSGTADGYEKVEKGKNDELEEDAHQVLEKTNSEKQKV